MPTKRIACLGGGSLHFTSAIPDLLLAPDLTGSEIVLYDIELEKAKRMAAAANRLAKSAGTGFRVRAASSLAAALDGTDFVLTSIGGSGADIGRDVYRSYYHNLDMYIPAKYGIHQLIGDTCGPAGMMMGLRSIPVYLNICREMEKRCPQAVLFNHSNPMAVLCRAMQKYSSIPVIGICHGVQAGIVHASRLLEVPATELECTWVGTNHYYWFTGVWRGKEDLYPELRRRAKQHREKKKILSAELSQIYGYQIVYPSDDHIIEFYPFLPQVHSQEEMPYGMKESAIDHGFDESRPMPARETVTPALRKAFFAKYQGVLDKMKLPEQRVNPVWGEAIGAMVSAMACGRREVYIMNVANRGAVPNLPDHAVVVIEAVTDSRSVRPVFMGEAPLMLKGILEKRFVWQELVADAGVKGDRKLALQALLIDEMAILPGPAEKMLNELLASSRDLLLQFFRKGKA